MAQLCEIDEIIEGAILDGVASNEIAAAAGFMPVPRSHERATDLIVHAIRLAKAIGASDKEIVHALEINLSTYGVEPKSAPIVDWMRQAAEGI